MGAPVEVHEHPPWLGWLLVCLCRQRAKQTWLVWINKTKLKGADQRGRSDVPGLAGWTYYFHGMGLELSGPGKEHIDYDFHDSEGATIDPYFFAHRVERLDPKAFPEARLARWLSSPELVVTGLKQIREKGLIGHLESEHVFLLSSRLEALHARVAAVDFADGSVARRWSAHLGDPEPLTQDPGDVRSRHEEWILALLQNRASAGRIIGDVAQHLPRKEFIVTCRELLAGPIDHTTGRTAEALDEADADAVTCVEHVLGRLDPALHHPSIAHAVVRYLLSRGLAQEHAKNTLVRFAEVERVQGYGGNPMHADLATLALEYAPERALALVRRALRSTTPIVVQDMSALLVHLDQPWCRRELTSALMQAGDERMARALAFALLNCDDERAQRTAREWTPTAAERASGAPGPWFEDVQFSYVRNHFEYYLSRTRPAAARLRGKLPPDFGT